MAEHNEIGKIGENITKTFLMKQGFMVLECNYRTRYGEIDIIAQKDDKIHFVEVKSVKVRDFNHVSSLAVTPEDNLTFRKWSKIAVSVESWLAQTKNKRRWQIDLACVYIDTETRQGKVVLRQNVLKE